MRAEEPPGVRAPVAADRDVNCGRASMACVKKPLVENVATVSSRELERKYDGGLCFNRVACRAVGLVDVRENRRRDGRLGSCGQHRQQTLWMLRSCAIGLADGIANCGFRTMQLAFCWNNRS